MAKRKNTTSKEIETLTHKEAARRNIPTAEYEAMLDDEQKTPIEVAYARRNRDLDPQLVWRGKDEQDWSDLVVKAPPLYIQEKIHPKVLIDDLKKRSKKQRMADGEQDAQPDLFGDFNGVADEDAKTEFYKHDANWTNRMILGDSLSVMASLAEREGLRGKVQCIYFDPPYGIKFNSNFQWSTTTRDVKDGKIEHITREPEQVKAFRDTWRDGIHSYLTYLRDRLTVARDLLTDSGSIFVQIGDENVHRVRALMDEVFGDENFVSQITVAKTTGMSGDNLSSVTDFILWYSKSKMHLKYRNIINLKVPGGEGATAYNKVYQYDGIIRPASKSELEKPDQIEDGKLCAVGDITSNRSPGKNDLTLFQFRGENYSPGNRTFGTNEKGMIRAGKADRIVQTSNGKIAYRRLLSDWPANPITNIWLDTVGQNQFGGSKIYVVQTALPVIQRCILMSTDPGDLVLDPTCGSGTTALVGEEWGRRWITIDTSRVSLALARARIMGAKYDYYLLADSLEGQLKEAELQRKAVSTKSTYRDIRHGFVYSRVAHISLKDIANNKEIDIIWDKFQDMMEPVRQELNKELSKKWEEWEIPREAGYSWSNDSAGLHDDIRKELDKSVVAGQPRIQNLLERLNRALDRTYTLEDLPEKPFDPWPDKATQLHAKWWKLRINRQKEMDASIAANAEQEYLYDRPYSDKNKVRVAGPFTVESLSPHRVAVVDENDNIIDNRTGDPGNGYGKPRDFGQLILENLRVAGIQQAHKEDRITFESLEPWPGEYIAAEGYYMEGENRKRAGILIGPEFGTVSRPDLVSAAREAADAGFDVVIACAFSYEAHAGEFNKLGKVPVLKANMNADLHMADDLSGKGNLFVIFGEPDIDILELDDNQYQVRVNGVDVFHPQTGEIRSDNADGIACWFLDTDYNEESFFVRHAYFLGAGDPYKSLKTTLKAEINQEAWETLYSDISRPFDKPESGRIAVKVINHLGDEVMKVFRVGN